jgi:myo-inositol-1-phosphate synthase
MLFLRQDVPVDEESGVTRKIRVAIAGVGNCASSLIQGVYYYRDLGDDSSLGLMHADLGGYNISDIEFVAAFDVDEKKVGFDLGEAVFRGVNNTVKFADVPVMGVKVARSPTLDGWGKEYNRTEKESTMPPVDVARRLRDAATDVLICYLPVGSEQAAQHFAEAALEARVGFVNCIPVFLASTDFWSTRFTEVGVPIIGDDVKAQVGATIIHRLLMRLVEERGGVVDSTYQVNIGGNMDFLNMTDADRVGSKLVSKVGSVSSQLIHELPCENIHAGPGGHIPWLKDRKIAYIYLEGRAFGGVPLTINVRLDCWDSPNSAGVVVDAIRYTKIAMDAGVGGPLVGPCAYLMKTPPRQVTDEEARCMTNVWLQDVLDTLNSSQL